MVHGAPHDSANFDILTQQNTAKRGEEIRTTIRASESRLCASKKTGECIIQLGVGVRVSLCP